MATRLDLRQRALQGAGLSRAQHTPDMDLLGGLFDPGFFYTGFRPGSTQNAPQRMDALQALRQGGAGGLSAFDQLFNAAGQVSDPSGLLRALNAGEVLSQRPRTWESFANNGFGGQTTPVLGGNNKPMSVPYGPGATGAAYAGSQAAPELLEWLKSMNLYRGGGGDVAYDPGNLRYQNYQVAPGMDLRNSTRQQLENWAQQQYGVDLLTLAASPTALLESRKKYMGNPNAIFNPEDPGALKLTRIPGLDLETSAARMGAYTSGVQRTADEASTGRTSRLSGQLTELLRTNPEAMRTGFGRQAGLTGDFNRAAQATARGALPQPMDYSMQYQAALLPEMINRAVQAALQGVL